MRCHVLFALLLSLGLSIVHASELKPGTYILDKNEGTLDIRRDAGKLVFEIFSVGSNGHICTPTGTIEGNIGRADEFDPEYPCDIVFESHGAAIAVRPVTEDACRIYCGARASFDGAYRTLPANCTPAARTLQGEKFLTMYRARDYAKAVEILDRLAAQCDQFMGWIETDQLRNDVALSRYHQGKHAQCLATIDKTTAGEMLDEEELKRRLTPFDFDNYVEIAKAIWFNRELCRKAIARKPESPRPIRPAPAR